MGIWSGNATVGACAGAGFIPANCAVVGSGDVESGVTGAALGNGICGIVVCPAGMAGTCNSEANVG